MSEKIKKRKIMLVGTGFVGMSFAYSMLSEKGIDELVLVDVNEDKAKGEQMDLNDGLVYADTKMKISAGTYGYCLSRKRLLHHYPVFKLWSSIK